MLVSAGRTVKPRSAYRDSDRIDVLVEDLLAIVGPFEKSLVYYDGEPGCGADASPSG